MKIQGISHITLLVSNLENTARLLTEGLDACEIYDSKGHNFSIVREKFFLLGDVWLATMEGPPLVERTYNHIAFQIDDKDLSKIENKLRNLGIDILPSRPRVDGEGSSLYFYDFDNHLFELHTGTLAQRLERYSKHQ